MESVWNYIKSDYYRYSPFNTSGSGVEKAKAYTKLLAAAFLAKEQGFTYSFWFRLASRPNILRPFARLKKWRLGKLYGIQIPTTTRIGHGFYLGHAVGMVVNGHTTIGNNCNLSHFLSIGTNHGTPARIGDNVYIGPNVCIVEDVEIGDNATIGAGAVVTKNIPANATAAGVPCKVITFDNPARYIGNPWPCTPTTHQL